MSSALHVVFDNKHWTKLPTDSLWWLVRYLKKMFVLSLAFDFGFSKISKNLIWDREKRVVRGRGIIERGKRMKQVSLAS